MKKTAAIIFVFLLWITLAGCAGKQETETDMSPGEIAAAIQSSQQGLPELTMIAPGDAEFTTWLSDYYLLQDGLVSDGAICYAEGVEASEIAVLYLAEEQDCKAAEEAMREYIRNRASVFEGYAPQQAAMAEKGIVAEKGRYVALLICPEPQTARKAFLDCFGKSAVSSGNGAERAAGETRDGENPDETKAGEGIKETEVGGNPEATKAGEQEGFYHKEAVLAAFRSGEDSSLSDTDRSILNAAKNVIASEITDDMSDYEKELAIHDYITGWSKFDYAVFGRSGTEGLTDGSDTPYGVLINQSAMCHGYSSTFQLFMDMLGIECITVYGLPGSNGVEHSWNMVKLDEEWYCVDCAWDDPIGGRPGHTYFNVTNDYLRSGSIHRWDETSVPEATGTAYAYHN